MPGEPHRESGSRARSGVLRRAAAGAVVVALAGTAGAAPEAARPLVEFGHLTACVADPATTGRFLESALGWRVLRRTEGKGAASSASDALHVEDGRGFRLLLRRKTSKSPGCSGAPYEAMTFVTSDLRGVAARFAPEPREPRSVRSIDVPRALSAGTPVVLQSIGVEARTKSARAGTSGARVDRIAIFVADLEKAADFYTKALGLSRSTASVELDGAANARSGGMRVAFIDARGVWLALVQPVGPGPLMDFLRQNGDGYIAELIVEVDDLAAEYDRMQSRGVVLVDTGGKPVDPQEKAHVLYPYGDRIAYFPTEVAGGLVIELAQRGPAETSLLEQRDRAPKVGGAPR